MTETAPRTAAITNLGCKVNQAEMEAAARLLRERGARLVDDRTRADLHLVNTCTVTAIADQKSRQAVRRARRQSPDAAIVVAGCSAQVDPDAFSRLDPAARVVGNEGKADLLAELAALAAIPGLAPEPTTERATEPGPEPTTERAPEPTPGLAPEPTLATPLPTLAGVDPVRAAPLDGAADDRTAAERTRAFVKVQDGCSFYCTYCLIPAARGPERSLPAPTVLADTRRALAAGHREIVLTGINIGTYDGGSSERGPRGSHRRSALTLAGLVRRILAETEVERIRLSSIEPQHLDDDLLDAWQTGAGRCLPHFHVPLQSGDDGVLRRMGRRYSTAEYARIVGRARAAVPGLALHADLIAGFPTEDDAAFERSIAFVRSIGFAGLHVFRYSPRPETPALRMAGQVPEPTRRARAARLLALADACRSAHAARRRGSVASVLFETRLADGRWIGHAEDHMLVAVAAPAPDADLANAIGRVAIETIDPDQPDRAVGRLLALDPPRPTTPAVPTVPATPEPVPVPA